MHDIDRDFLILEQFLSIVYWYYDFSILAFIYLYKKRESFF